MERLINDDCKEFLKTLPDNSIDSLLTDPPAGISFMNKEWDSNKGGRKEWCAWMTEVMKEVHRVIKPGAHGLVWALPRTSHWTATALEDAGFEIRDVITHLFGSGFPKSHNISKAIEKSGNSIAEQWNGWGTALKPASEHWILIRKPISEKTVAANVLKWGVGGLNIDGCRISTSEVKNNSSKFKAGYWQSEGGKGERWTGNGTNNPQGRFPANLVLSHSIHCADDQCDIECAIQMLDAQSGILKSGENKIRLTPKVQGNDYRKFKQSNPNYFPKNFGGASRFFYCAKISSRERNEGPEGMPLKEGLEKPLRTMSDPRMDRPQIRNANQNNHPTVKSKKLMAYLARLITPPKGTVLDPFMGSGSTGLACKDEGFGFIGIEKEKDYFEIAQRRIG